MKNQIQSWFSAPVFKGDEEKTWRASLINLSIITCVLIVILILIGNFIGGRTPTSVFIIDGIMLAVLYVIHHWLKKGHITLAGISLVAMGMVLITVATASLGTIRSPTTAFLFLIVIIAGLLFGKIGLYLSSVFGSLAVLGLMLAENAGVLPQADFSVTITQWVSYTVGFVLLGALTHFTYSSNRQTLERAFREMAERKRAEEAYENIVNHSLQAFVIFQDERIVFANPETEQISGYTREELYAMTPEQVFSLVPEEDRKERLEMFRGRMAGVETPDLVAFRITRKDGTTCWLESYNSVVDYQGRPAIQSAYIDITERKQNEEQLRKLSRAVEAAPVSIVITDKNARIEYVNPHFSEITGFEPDEITNANPSVLQSGLTPPGEYEQLWKKILSGRPWEGEFINKKKNGELYTELALISPIFDVSNKITHFVAIKQDITQRKQTEQKLMESEERFRVLFEDSADAYLILEGNLFVDCNQATTEMLRAKSKEEVLSLHPSDLSPEFQPDGMLSVEKADKMIHLALENGSNRFEWVHRRMDGEEFPVEVLLTPITVGEKTIIHTVWQDITGRKKIEGELKISEERHRKIIEHAGDIVYRISLMGYFEYVNPQAELLTGYSEDELIGMLFVDLVHPDWRDRVQEFYLDQRNQKIAETTFQLPIITKAGDEKWIEQIVNLIVEGESRISLQGIARDITRRKHAEEREQEQRNLAEALRKSAEALNQSLSLDEVLKIIVENAMKMVSCDSASITWVLDTDVRIVEYRGLGEEQESWFMDRTFQLDEFATYKKVVQDKKPLIIQDTTADPRWIQLQHTEWIRSHLEAPVIIDGKVIAIISLDSKVPGFYNKEQARNLQAFANQAAVAIHKASLFEEIQNLATTDDLTSLYNRRGFYEISRREVGRLQRYGRPFSVLFIDIDLFKQFNDQYSYAVGDQVLQWVADLLQSNVREIDVVGRYGGEEIVILLPEIDNSEAEEIAERIRIIIEKSHFSLGQDKLQITVSIGVATLSPTPEETILTNPEAQTKAIEDLIAKAGDALHKAKQQGRNRVVTYES